MSVEYLGKVNNLITGTDLKNLFGFVGQNPFLTPTGDITFLKYKENNQIRLLGLFRLYNYSWNGYNDFELVFGKEIVIENKRYRVGMIQGADVDPVVNAPSPGTNNEYQRYVIDFWDKIKDFPEVSSLRARVLCKETSASYNTNALWRMMETNGVCTSNTVAKSDASSTAYSFVPFLKSLAPYIECDVTDLGELTSWGNDTLKITPYSIVGNSLYVYAYVDNVSIGTKTCTSEQEAYIALNNFDSLSYGKHTLKLIPADIQSGGELGEPIEITFTKVKSPNPPLTDPNLKKLINQIDLVNEDLEYQCMLMGNDLKDKGANVKGGESLSQLIGMLKNINTGKKWASGVTTTSSKNTIANISNLGFKPSIIATFIPYDGTFGFYIKDYTFNPNNTKLDTFFVFSSSIGARYWRDIDETKVYLGGFNLEIGYSSVQQNKEFRWLAVE